MPGRMLENLGTLVLSLRRTPPPPAQNIACDHGIHMYTGGNLVVTDFDVKKSARLAVETELVVSDLWCVYTDRDGDRSRD